MTENIKFAVVGGGSWATAIAKMLCVNQKEICWYMRNEFAIEHLQIHHHNLNYLTSVEFDVKKLNLTSDINEAVAYADYIIFAIPSAFLGAELEKLTVSLKDKVIFSAIKGIVPETSLIVGEHFNTVYDIPFDNIGVITGPCHAEEVALVVYGAVTPETLGRASRGNGCMVEYRRGRGAVYNAGSCEWVAGLIAQEKRGRVKWCKLEPDALRAASVWMQGFGVFDPVDLDAFERFLADELADPIP
jgi:hypothetical protein